MADIDDDYVADLELRRMVRDVLRADGAVFPQVDAEVDAWVLACGDARCPEALVLRVLRRVLWYG